MSEENQKPDQYNPPKKPRAKKHLRNFGAAVSTVAALHAGTALAANKPHPPRVKKPTPIHNVQPGNDPDINRASAIASRLIGIPKSELAGKGLRKVDTLPGYNHQVTPELRALLNRSTVRIVERPKNSYDPWSENCTANKITWHGQEYVTSAAHCFNKMASVDYDNTDGWGAQNILGNIPYEYAIALDNIQEPIAVVTGVSASMPDHDDWALLETEPTGTKGGPANQFEDLPALDYDKLATAPQLGEQVALYSEPEANEYHPVMATGRYLGQYLGTSNQGEPQKFDVVGINPNDPRDDACNYGSSGSSAMSASGYIFGPLSERFNSGYSDGLPNPTGDENPVDMERSILRFLEPQLGIDTSQFSTICLYNIRKSNGQNSMVDTMGMLTKGFYHLAPLPTMK